MFPITWGGVYVGGGSGGGYGGVSVSGTTVIGTVSGGLVFRLGSQKTKSCNPFYNPFVET